MNQALRKRIATAVVLGAAVLVILLWLPAWVSVVVLCLALLLGAWEWSAFLRTSAALRGGYVGLIALLMYGAWLASANPAARTLLMALALAWWCIALLWVTFAPRHVAAWSAALAGVLTLVPAWLALVRLRLDPPGGAQWLLYVLLLVWAADIGAYFSGRAFGRVALAPQVSPAKTWEGVLGGLALSSLCALAGALWFQLPPRTFLLLSLAAVGFSIVGDLTESLLKRYAGLKDSGKLFPGHGGIMDRIDSLSAAAPVMFIGLTLFGVTQ